MNITKLILSALFIAPFAAMPLQAVQVAANAAEAKKLVKEDGYIIFSYAEGWDEYSKQRCEALMADKEIRRAAGDAVLMLNPIAEAPDEARATAIRELREGLNIPGAWSYPALIFISKEGWHYATVNGSVVARGKSRELAAIITDRMEKGQKRRRMDAEAFKVGGPSMARLRFDAHQIDGLSGMDKGTRAAIRAADPQDTTGVIRATNFDAYGFATRLGNNGVESGLRQVDAMLTDTAYTPRQKQQMCAAAIGMLRRQGNIVHAASMRRYATLMQKLVPDSAEGKAAPYILANWIPSLNISRGWNPSCIPAQEAPIELEGELPIKDAGTYTVRFDYTKGNFALVIHAVALYDGTTKVAEDVHQGVAGTSPRQNTYTLTAPSRLREPRIRVTLGQRERDSHGKITIEKK